MLTIFDEKQTKLPVGVKISYTKYSLEDFTRNERRPDGPIEKGKKNDRRLEFRLELRRPNADIFLVFHSHFHVC